MHIPFLKRVSFHLSHHSKSLYRLLLRLSFSFLMSVLPKSLFSFSESSEKSKADIALEICVRNRQLENGGELTGTTVIGVFFLYRLTYWFDVVCRVSWFFGVCFAFVLELLDTSFFFLIAG